MGKLLGILIIVSSLGLGWFWQSINHFKDSAIHIDSGSVDFSIKAGSSLTTVANQLAQKGLIDKSSLFVWMIRLNNLPASVQSGEYLIQSGMSPKEILLMFANGKVKQYSFTIVEGWNYWQLFKAIKNNTKIKNKLVDKSNQEVIQLLDLDVEHLEGQFLPDTYYFTAGTTDIEFLKRANVALNEVLASEWASKSNNIPIKTAYEALILASIVEKETAVASERKRISGVFSRRLEKKMRLQTDPTIIYGLGQTFDGNLKKKHLKDKSNPYNTYRIKGLPPTPIAMPGRDAIHAALHPASGEELYFVAKGDGSHHFSSTNTEHNAAVRKYQIKQRKINYRSTPKDKEPG